MNYERKYNKYKTKYLDLKIKMEHSMVDAEDTRPLESIISSNNIEVSIIKKRFDEYEPYMFTNNMSRNIKMILKIDNIEIFDKFTNKYTEVKDNVLKIDWKNLSMDYKGLYMVNNKSDMRLKRYTKAPKNGKKYKSWWVKEIKDDSVIEFDRTESTENDYDDPRLPLDPNKIEEKMNDVDSTYTDSDLLLESTE